jgi:hypothetical protein
MMTAHIGEIGLEIQFQLLDENGSILDVSGTTVTILIHKPSGVYISKSASFLTDGSDGLIRYATQSGDLDESGEYQAQAKIEWAGGVLLYSGEIEFSVSKTIA